MHAQPYYLRLPVLKLAFPLAQVGLPLVSPLFQLPGFEGVGLELHFMGLGIVFGFGQVFLYYAFRVRVALEVQPVCNIYRPTTREEANYDPSAYALPPFLHHDEAERWKLVSCAKRKALRFEQGYAW